MKRVVRVTSDVLGGLGAGVCLGVGIARLLGYFYVLGVETISVFQGGVGLMVAACLFKLWSLERGTTD